MGIVLGWCMALVQRLLVGCWSVSRVKEPLVVHRPSEVLRSAHRL